mmetsp:Transcript_33697/g.61463  ORF Transcript_33697/g.61463 Transcript_33697/m.61463 type:complete len:265 (-) Transcript_33697:8-802(-)
MDFAGVALAVISNQNCLLRKVDVNQQARSLPAVLQYVEHQEPAAIVDEFEASMIAHEQYAGFVERNMGAASDKEDAPENEILLLKLNRNPAALRKSLCEGAELQICRNTLERSGYSWKHESGALVFVHPQLYDETMDHLRDSKLHPDNIVVSKAFDHLLCEVLAQHKPAWVKSRVEISLIDNGSDNGSDVGHASSSNERNYPSVCDTLEDIGEMSPDTWKVQVVRTFICCEVHCETSDVTRSSTDAHCPNLKNPRNRLTAMHEI